MSKGHGEGWSASEKRKKRSESCDYLRSPNMLHLLPQDSVTLRIAVTRANAFGRFKVLGNGSAQLSKVGTLRH